MKENEFLLFFILKKKGQNIKPTAVDGISIHTQTHTMWRIGVEFFSVIRPETQGRGKFEAKWNGHTDRFVDEVFFPLFHF